MSVFLSAYGIGQQFFDNNGNILAGGKIWTYQAGTTTLEATYESASGITQNPNPIVLDSAGRSPNAIWLAAGQAYRFDLTDANDVALDSVDNVGGINDGSLVSAPWASITGKPTTLAGYGITDAVSAATAATTYAPIASPTFTGTPQVPDNAATSSNWAVGYRDAPPNGQTANYQLVLADRGKSVVMNGSSLTLTIPANSAVAFPVGTVIIIVNLNATAFSIAITTDTMTLANSTTTGTRTLARNGMATLVKIAATSWLISGAGLT